MIPPQLSVSPLLHCLLVFFTHYSLSFSVRHLLVYPLIGPNPTIGFSYQPTPPFTWWAMSSSFSHCHLASLTSGQAGCLPACQNNQVCLVAFEKGGHCGLYLSQLLQDMLSVPVAVRPWQEYCLQFCVLHFWKSMDQRFSVASVDRLKEIQKYERNI